jgi:hypothetical protein
MSCRHSVSSRDSGLIRGKRSLRRLLIFFQRVNGLLKKKRIWVVFFSVSAPLPSNIFARCQFLSVFSFTLRSTLPCSA